MGLAKTHREGGSKIHFVHPFFPIHTKTKIESNPKEGPLKMFWGVLPLGTVSIQEKEIPKGPSAYKQLTLAYRENDNQNNQVIS
ncbi:oligopeptide/dipeptide ABC transporter, ATPase subunit [Leptospira ryugenii]|uniref:Oligopeptide/dipeptide ABC transporter, ATPase subunit n=1 Tax=Leptospira ryugenii TaxID=1917863 RepID=A0A2P2DX86_9LEPT|nr:oligopeptide/dipeptide ABC transporter, ATPase subunit [Leptospira ryugenii]